MSSLATEKAQVVILAALVFLLGEFTVLTKLFRQVGLFRLTLGRVLPLGFSFSLPFPEDWAFVLELELPEF
jgi:hypothetical protein